jgi:hypothetical protein
MEKRLYSEMKKPTKGLLRYAIFTGVLGILGILAFTSILAKAKGSLCTFFLARPLHHRPSGGKRRPRSFIVPLLIVLVFLAGEPFEHSRALQLIQFPCFFHLDCPFVFISQSCLVKETYDDDLFDSRLTSQP